MDVVHVTMELSAPARWRKWRARVKRYYKSVEETGIVNMDCIGRTDGMYRKGLLPAVLQGLP